MRDESGVNQTKRCCEVHRLELKETASGGCILIHTNLPFFST